VTTDALDEVTTCSLQFYFQIHQKKGTFREKLVTFIHSPQLLYAVYFVTCFFMLFTTSRVSLCCLRRHVGLYAVYDVSCVLMLFTTSGVCL
jgi:hypothetical protein